MMLAICAEILHGEEPYKPWSSDMERAYSFANAKQNAHMY